MGATLKQQVRQPENPRYYAAFSNVSKTYAWADGTVIGIYNAGDYVLYIFRRTDNRKPDGGEWLPLGITTGAAATW